jgi:hypothetical protein
MRTKVLCLIALVGLSSIAGGCLSPNANPRSQANAAHDAVLERFIAGDYNATAQSVTIDTWEVKWINSTALIVNADGHQKGTDNLVSINKTVKRLASIDASNDTMNTYDLSNYTQVQSASVNETIYAQAIGKDATVFKVYEETSQSPTSLTVARVMQFDDIIAISETTTSQTPSATPTPLPQYVPPAPTPQPTPIPTEAPTATPIAPFGPTFPLPPFFPIFPTPTPAT